ncbi:uncharacterized protein LOC125951416 [Anopheles darlingi]|nr:uncharacterized protein LOC125951416 [Anopheles darlingi]
MRFLALICVLLALAAVVTAAKSCKECNRNECDCERAIARGPPPQPYPFYKKKKCNVTRPLELKPTHDVCSCEQEYRVRPLVIERVEPKFAKSRSCECGYENHGGTPTKKYPADLISRQLALEYARKTKISESDLHVHGRPVTVPPPCKPDVIQEERLFKNTLQVLEMKQQKKRVKYRVQSSEETEGIPCHPKEESYCAICYGKVEPREPKFELLRQDGPVCEECKDYSRSEELEEVDDYTEAPPKSHHCNKCKQPKKSCGCKEQYDSYESAQSYEDDCPLKRRSRAIPALDNAKPSVPVV